MIKLVTIAIATKRYQQPLSLTTMHTSIEGSILTKDIVSTIARRELDTKKITIVLSDNLKSATVEHRHVMHERDEVQITVIDTVLNVEHA